MVRKQTLLQLMEITCFLFRGIRPYGKLEGNLGISPLMKLVPALEFAEPKADLAYSPSPLQNLDICTRCGVCPVT